MVKYILIRPNLTTGYGPVIDDLERMADKSSHGMRNESDPANWAHELTHYVNSMFRQSASRAGKPWNGFYCLNGYALILPEPSVTLAQVASLVPKDLHDDVFKNYLVDSRRWWNNEPLYILDEAVAAMNGLEYVIQSGHPDKGRSILVEKWIRLSPYLLKAVEKFDPGYSHLDELRAFVAWQRAYSFHLVTKHIRLAKTR